MYANKAIMSFFNAIRLSVRISSLTLMACVQLNKKCLTKDLLLLIKQLLNKTSSSNSRDHRHLKQNSKNRPKWLKLTLCNKQSLDQVRVSNFLLHHPRAHQQLVTSVVLRLQVTLTLRSLRQSRMLQISTTLNPVEC